MVAMKCSELKTIYLQDCPKISAEQCATLKELFPLVSWVTAYEDEDEDEDESESEDEDADDENEDE